MKIKVFPEQSDPKFSKSKYLGKTLTIPVDNLNEK